MQLKFNVTGMTCAACSARVEKVATQIPGVEKAEVNLLAGTMSVNANERTVIPQILAAIEKAGYGATVMGDTPVNRAPADNSLPEMKRRIIYSAIFLVVLMYFTMGHMIHLPMPGWYHGDENALVAVLVQLFLTLPVLYWNRAYYRKGIRSLLHRSPNMDSLIAVGSGAAFVYGVVALFRMAYAMGNNQMDVVVYYSQNLYFESAAMILTLVTLGKYLETRAKKKTGDAISRLMDLNPKTATVRRNDINIELPIEQVVVGDTVIIRAGGRIPVDGTILSGRATVDQSALTGESIPVEKSVGDSIAAGTTNLEGYLEMCADRVGEDTTLFQIIRMVEEAGGSKAPIARLADKIAGIFVPVVMTIAAITFFVWLFSEQSLEFALNMAISVLVISCPCALGLATPVAIMVGTGRAAGMGVLFRNAEALENLHKIDTVVLDKTGTLTKGQPEVTDVIPAAVTETELLMIAASLEEKSEHPFATAIINKAISLPKKKVSDFQVLPGRGVRGIIDGTEYLGGNRRLMEEIGISVPDFHQLTEKGKTPLYFASRQAYLGAIAAADVLKTDSVSAVQAMHRLNLDVIMLTGDNAATGGAIGDIAGISNIISDVLPGDKAGVISDLQKLGHRVLMVGDGINDAPALATADVSMAIGNGTDIAVESADVVLMNNSLCGVAQAVELSKATIRNIKQNLFWAFFYNSLGIPIAAGILYPGLGIALSPMIGAAAMSMSSVFVVTNALRLRWFRTKTRLKASQKAEIIKEKRTMTTVINVEGMMCPHCKARVESVCKEVPGATDAVVNLQAKTVTVTGDVDLNTVKKAILDAGYEIVE
ncbi:MAG: cadmium-translocating P-type ATPase [Oscillospiraceae bacterium]|nr:cadmium-translocating P-type ATPase [Oscillospiraceae bacterium]